MKRLLAALAGVVHREPVRVRLYALLTAVVVYQLGRGRLHADDAKLYLEVGAAVLGVETARAKVTPTASKPPHTLRIEVNGDNVHKALLEVKRRNGGKGLGLS